MQIAQSSTLRNLATREDLEALTLRNFDSSTFNAWFIAFTLNSPQKEAIAIRRFRPAFRVAFDAWIATDPLTNPHAPPGPTYMPQYKLPQQAKATTGQRGDGQVQRGQQRRADQRRLRPDHRVPGRGAVPGGIGSTFKLHQIRYALITFGTALLILAVVLIFHEPGPPG